jgi:hypothetical protein
MNIHTSFPQYQNLYGSSSDCLDHPLGFYTGGEYGVPSLEQCMQLVEELRASSEQVAWNLVQLPWEGADLSRPVWPDHPGSGPDPQPGLVIDLSTDQTGDGTGPCSEQSSKELVPREPPPQEGLPPKGVERSSLELVPMEPLLPMEVVHWPPMGVPPVIKPQRRTVFTQVHGGALTSTQAGALNLMVARLPDELFVPHDGDLPEVTCGVIFFQDWCKHLQSYNQLSWFVELLDQYAFKLFVDPPRECKQVRIFRVPPYVKYDDGARRIHNPPGSCNIELYLGLGCRRVEFNFKPFVVREGDLAVYGNLNHVSNTPCVPGTIPGEFVVIKLTLVRTDGIK